MEAPTTITPTVPARASTAAARRDLRTPGLLFLAVGAAFLVVTMLAASVAPGYDMHGGKISDLGVIPETALLFNLLLIGIGVLNAAGGYLLVRGRRHAWLAAIYLLAGVGAAGAGVFPLSTGAVHSLFALLAFVSFNLESLGTARLVSGVMRLLAYLAGAVGLVSVVVMVIGDAGDPGIFGAIGHGGAERMIAYPVMVWLMAFGGYLVGSSERVALRR